MSLKVSPSEIDWKLKLVQILAAVDDVTDQMFTPHWKTYGVTDEERQTILIAYYEHYGLAW